MTTESAALDKTVIALAELRHQYRVAGRWNAETEAIYDMAGALLDAVSERAEVLYERRQVTA